MFDYLPFFLLVAFVALFPGMVLGVAKFDAWLEEKHNRKRHQAPEP